MRQIVKEEEKMDGQTKYWIVVIVIIVAVVIGWMMFRQTKESKKIGQIG